MRVAHALLGGAAGVGWLLLPVTTISTDVPVAISADAPVAAAESQDEETSATDLALPLVVLAAAGTLAGYAYIRRIRRARTRTTPGGAPATPAVPPLTDLDEQSRTLLTEADNWIRTSREELAFAEARSGAEAVAPFARALHDAQTELSAAFRIRRRYDAGIPADQPSRRHALTGIVGRCQEAGSRLDAQAPAFDQLRALEREDGEAVRIAETRFRELTGRTPVTEATATDLTQRYAPSASAPVTGYVEEAKNRLVLATTHLNHSRQATDSGDTGRAVHALRAAESAVAQADVFLTAVDRLAEDLRTAAGLVPAALTGAETELAVVREVLAGAPRQPAAAPPNLPEGELRARLRHADIVLTAVRNTLTGGQRDDPLDLLRRIAEAVAPVAAGRTGVLPAAALLTARSAIADADGFVETHRAVVGAEARTLLAAAREALEAGHTRSDTAAEGPVPTPATLTTRLHAGTSARRARELAEQDVRLHGNPSLDPAPANSFGGPRTAARRNPPPG
ncbi:putative protein OS=Streptomyces aurantiogriseus OX=66870 GN=GCM10010251_18440 PE=4 SV=1 [Streptomyces aurantiogriseus]|uniref:Uncharacterized protein n=1 Tax=Streptomyces aurantiogriseus TaxID=66870 RepID=A0A918C2V6_9ACTN|nr:hypothetical protein GCM10010251_18440 [Streptomyces aurantiogriseus]